MKKICLLISFFLLSLVLSTKTYAEEPDPRFTVTAQADNTATAWMQAIVASLQPNTCYVKIGSGYGGTDTARKWAAVKDDIAEALGISVEALEDMTGIDVITSFFPDLPHEDLTQLSSGESSVEGLANSANTSFNIYVGPSGSDVIHHPSFILHFNLHP